jgi:tripartite-type tricarboxylate transporter receptor subunit TctC
LKLIAVSSAKRIEQLPNVPTIAETYPGYVAETWNGILGPAGMPQSAVNQIAAVMSKAYADPKFIAQLQMIGVTPIPEVKEDFAKRIAEDTLKWKPIISDAGIKPE